jgi:hypothetical protein
MASSYIRCMLNNTGTCASFTNRASRSFALKRWQLALAHRCDDEEGIDGPTDHPGKIFFDYKTDVLAFPSTDSLAIHDTAPRQISLTHPESLFKIAVPTLKLKPWESHSGLSSLLRSIHPSGTQIVLAFPRAAKPYTWLREGTLVEREDVERWEGHSLTVFELESPKRTNLEILDILFQVRIMYDVSSSARVRTRWLHPDEKQILGERRDG